jgi:phosphatidate phosphatase PAH1
MKKAVLIFSILSLVFASSCKDVEETVDEFTQFTIAFNEETEVPPLPFNVAAGFTFPLPLEDISTDNAEIYAANNTAKNLLEEVLLQDAHISISNPDDPDFNFSFLESVEVYLSAEGLDEILIASNMDVPSEKTIVLNSVGQNLVEYLKKDSINYKIVITTDEDVSAGTQFNLQFISEFFVDAKILGV